jgi:hypothetical protein
VLSFLLKFRSRLFINGRLLVDNGGLHGSQQVCGTQNLEDGGYNVKVSGHESGMLCLPCFVVKGCR